VTPPGYVAPPPRAASPARRKLLGAALAAAAAAAVAFLLLGSSPGGFGGPLAQAATQTSRVAGYRMRMSLQVSSSALGSPVISTGSGVVDLRHHSSSLSVVMSGAANLRFEMVANGSAIYMKLPSGLGSTADGRWVKGDLSKLGHVSGLSSLAQDPGMGEPARILDSLRSVSDSVVSEGREQVGGALTTHYQAQIDPAHLLKGLSGIDDKALAVINQAMPATIPVDVWIDAHHLVRRVSMEFDMSLPQGQSLQESLTLYLGHYGPQPTPVVPQPDQVVDLSSLAGTSG